MRIRKKTSLLSHWRYAVFLSLGTTALLGLLPHSALAQLPVLEPGYLPADSRVTTPTTQDRTNEYLLGPGDLIQVEIFNAPDYSREYVVLSNGSLNLPLVGEVAVQGLTIGAASDQIQTAYAEFIRDPSVTLNLSQARSIRIAIAGEVNRPGAYSIDTPEAVEIDPVTVTEAIKLAGGITRLADIRNIQVLRSQPTSGIANSQIEIDLWNLIESGDLGQDLPLRDGDTVLVPTATAMNTTEMTRLATANFSPDNITVYVVGEVTSPGAVELPLNTPLNQALLASGGFTNRAVEGTVELVRLNPNGTVAKREVEVDFGQDVNETGNPVLQNNDTIVVRETGLAQTADTANLILSPLSGILGLLNLLF